MDFWFEIKKMGAQAAGDAAVRGDDRVAIQSFGPLDGARQQVGVALAALRPPAKWIAAALGEAFGIDVWQVGLQLPLPRPVGQFDEARVNAVGGGVQGEARAQDFHGLARAAERACNEIRGGDGRQVGRRASPLRRDWARPVSFKGISVWPW